ncbi:MAG: response regulator [Sphingomonas sp.]|uniref:response regulator transcription factor n=1 Tax=Sphingomonas sp. TaxID=28214 RepID=UPI001ACB2840|nr:response regulator [Sphingomonas sp.]MBN8808677.1 response regulator [Sphingomonas sp.]
MAKIVIVDDDELVIEKATPALERAGHEVVTVHHGDEAMAAIIDNRADLVILDQMLPGRSGMHILAELRQHPDAVDLPVMMLTSRGTPLHIELADRSGADDYVTKPFDPGGLPARVQALLRGAGISRAARTGAEAPDADAGATED